MCAIDCTAAEIAAVLGISTDTLNNRIKEEFGVTSSEWIEQHRMIGNASLRRMQWRTAENGNVQMQIFLGKQRLGQREKAVIGEDGDNPFLAELRDAHQRALERLNVIEGEVDEDENDI